MYRYSGYGTGKGLAQPRTNQSRLDNTKHEKIRVADPDPDPDWIRNQSG
jgi:hypothetical protein